MKKTILSIMTVFVLAVFAAQGFAAQFNRLIDAVNGTSLIVLNAKKLQQLNKIAEDLNAKDLTPAATPYAQPALIAKTALAKEYGAAEKALLGQKDWSRAGDFLKWLQDNESSVKKRIAANNYDLNEVFGAAAAQEGYPLLAGLLGYFYIADKYVAQDSRHMPNIRVTSRPEADADFKDLNIKPNSSFVVMLNAAMRDSARLLNYIKAGDARMLNEFAPMYVMLSYGLPVKMSKPFSYGTRNPLVNLAARPADIKFLNEYSENILTLVFRDKINRDTIFNFTGDDIISPKQMLLGGLLFHILAVHNGAAVAPVLNLPGEFRKISMSDFARRYSLPDNAGAVETFLSELAAELDKEINFKYFLGAFVCPGSTECNLEYDYSAGAVNNAKAENDFINMYLPALNIDAVYDIIGEVLGRYSARQQTEVPPVPAGYR